ncbi:MAG: hypothetical protein VW169_01445 [Rhodospirillaceae bacterium]
MPEAFLRSAKHASERTGIIVNNVRAMASSPELGAIMRRFLDDVWDQG